MPFAPFYRPNSKAGIPYAKKDVMKRSRANSAIIQGICPAFLYIKDDSPTTMLYDYGGGDQLD